MIRIKCDAFEFSSENHINILGAEDGLIYDSGTHKSHLMAILGEYQTEGALESNCVIHLADSPFIMANLDFHSNDCIIIDEWNYAPGQINDLLQRVRAANAYLIFIGRMNVRQLEYSVDAIYTFEYVDGRFPVKKYFGNTARSEWKSETVVCEDSAPVAALYAEILDYDSIQVANGRSNFFKYIKDFGVAFLIADKPKFGQDLLSLVYQLKSNHYPVRYLLLFLPDCFEEVLYEAAENAGMIKNDLNREVYFDNEVYYEKAVDALEQWDKRKVARSIAELRMVLKFDQTEIMQDMKLFFENDVVCDPSRCYICDLEHVHISELKPRFSDR